MDIQFNYQHVSGSEELEAYTTEKINKLTAKYDWITRADVFFRTENTSSDETGMISEIRLSAPGPRLFAESSKANFHSGVNEVINQLDTQCKKRKAKFAEH